MMEGAWHVVLRDILIILSALALLCVSVLLGLVAWQVFRVARELRNEVLPIIASVQQTAETVRGTAEFMGGKVVAPAATAVGAAVGMKGIVDLIQQFYSGMSRSRQGRDDE